MKTRTILNFILFPLFCLSCSTPSMIVMNDEISFTATSYEVSSVEVKAGNESSGAYLYENLDAIQDKSTLGGYFNIKAYINGTSDEHFTDPTTVKYHTDTQYEPAWYIYNPTSNAFESRYWPKTYSLDFLAYMPLKRPNAGSTQEITQEIDPNTHITSFGYDTEAKSPTFSCVNLPLNKSDQAEAKEFMYAWAPGQSYDSVNRGDGATGKVKLNFQHSMAAVYFKIAGAHGGTTINSFGFYNIYNNGTFIVDSGIVDSGIVNSAKWIPNGSLANFAISDVGQKIPDDIQIGHTYGPYLVMPQEHSTDAKLFIDFTWREQEGPVAKSLNSEWESGKKYTYSLVLGDSAEDIMVNVSVETWGNPIGGNHEIEVK